MKKKLITTLFCFFAYNSNSFAQNPDEMVAALQGTFGKHEGKRPSHAKGFCAEGDFTGNPKEASIITTSKTFNNSKKTPFLARFSIGGGNPAASDKSKIVRGFSIRFNPNGESSMDLLMLSAPVFFVKDPKDFVGFLESRKPDPATGKPDPAKVKAYNDAHPDTKPQIEFLKNAPVPTSYGTIKYFSVNAFKFINNKNKEVFGRWIAEPIAKPKTYTEEEFNKLSDDFLKDEFSDRLKKDKKIEFNLYVQVAEKGDDVLDSTVEWPANRKKILVGKFSINKTANDSSCGLMFNPIALESGIQPSDDPILKARLPAYISSFAQRSQNTQKENK